MTVESTTNRWAYTGDGSTTAFAYTNRIFAATDLEVYVDDELQTNVTDYAVSGVAEASGGNVTFVSAPDDDAAIVIVRNVPATQGLDLAALGSFPAEENEKALDRLTVLAQQLGDGQARTLRQPNSDATAIGELPTAGSRAGMNLGFDDAGDPVARASSGEIDIPVPVSQGGTGATDASGARAGLGLAIGSDVQAFDADTLKADTSDQIDTGFTGNSADQGTKSSGTFTPDMATRNIQHYTNGGAHTLAPPAATGTMVIDMTNNASAGAVTTSGFTKVTGDTLTTTNGRKFRFFISVGNAGSHLHKQAMQ